MRKRGLLAAGAVVALAFSVSAQEEGGIRVESRPPRSVGYFVGDRIDYAGTVRVPAGYVLDEASKPRPRDLDYWLELASVSIEPVTERDATRYELSLRYQTFYVPLEPKELRIPPLTLGFVRAADGGRLEAALPGFTFVSSPLRPILERSSPEVMRPDAPLVVVDTRPKQWRTGSAFGASLALLVMLARYRGWLPTGQRRRRPLADAARRVARLGPEKSPQAYREALLSLHRGLDATFGSRLLADDLGLLLLRHPRLQEARGDLDRFFRASRMLHFSEDEAAAAAQFPPPDLHRLAKRLASIERAP